MTKAARATRVHPWLERVRSGMYLYLGANHLGKAWVRLKFLKEELVCNPSLCDPVFPDKNMKLKLISTPI